MFKRLLPRLRVVGPLVAALAILLLGGWQLFAHSHGAMALHSQQTVSAEQQSLQRNQVRIWVQTMDSCKQAIPGSYFVLTGGGLHVSKGPAPGRGRMTVSHETHGCPLERGNCARISDGCLYWDVPVPSQGVTTYTIKETKSPANYMPCTGGSVCPGGPVVITAKVSADGNVAATAFNVYPNRQTVTWPTSGQAYTGSPSDPIVVHNFELGNGSCDGDNDEDDHLTGSPSNQCDSDGDRRR